MIFEAIITNLSHLQFSATKSVVYKRHLRSTRQHRLRGAIDQRFCFTSMRSRVRAPSRSEVFFFLSKETEISKSRSDRPAVDLDVNLYHKKLLLDYLEVNSYHKKLLLDYLEVNSYHNKITSRLARSKFTKFQMQRILQDPEIPSNVIRIQFNVAQCHFYVF